MSVILGTAGMPFWSQLAADFFIVLGIIYIAWNFSEALYSWRQDRRRIGGNK